MKYPHRIVTLGISVALMPLAAQAHPGHETHASLLMGVMHPLTGWDHLMVLLSLGVLAAGRGTRLALAAVALLAVALSGGAALGLAFPEAAFVEPAILATVIASAVLLLLRARIGRGSLLALCLVFTLAHGMAHGQEAPSGDLAAYFEGFTLAGTAVFAAGVGLARSIVRARLSRHRARI